MNVKQESEDEADSCSIFLNRLTSQSSCVDGRLSSSVYSSYKRNFAVNAKAVNFDRQYESFGIVEKIY